jgi:hypothetical protein
LNKSGGINFQHQKGNVMESNIVAYCTLREQTWGNVQKYPEPTSTKEHYVQLYIEKCLEGSITERDHLNLLAADSTDEHIIIAVAAEQFFTEQVMRVFRSQKEFAGIV